MRVLVIGGTGFVGPHVVAGLRNRGHHVTVFHRGRTHAELPPGVHHVHCPSRAFGDRAYFSEFVDEFKRIAPDVVLDMIPVTAADARALMDVFCGLAGRVLAISSQDVYRAYGVLTGIESGPVEPVPLSEDAPLRQRLFPYRTDPPREPDDPKRWLDDYDKILVEQVVLDNPNLPGTVLRFPMVYGPRDRQHRMFEYLLRMDDSRPAILLEEGFARWRWTRGYVENVAAAVTLAVVDERATGRVYNVGELNALPTAEWVRRIGLAAGWNGQVVSAPRNMLPDDLHRQMNTEQNLVSDSARIRGELGYEEPVSRDEAIALTVAWERSHPPEGTSETQPDYAAEDAILAKLARQGSA